MILHDLMEAKAKEVAIIFGRFNPPHKGHKAAWEMAAQSPVWYVGTNKSTQGPKDPLPFDVKVKAMSAIWPAVADHIVAEQSWLTLASKVYAEHGDVVLNLLTDEEWVSKTINQYNGVSGPHGLYKFSKIVTKPTPRLSSATALRDAVIKGDRKAFADAAGVSADTKVDGVLFFDLVAQYLLPYQDKPKKKVKEARKSAWDRMMAAVPELVGTEKRSQDAIAGIKKANKDYQDILDKEKATKEDISEHIVKVKGGYRLVSKKSGKNLGTYPTKAGAEKRERQVQYFKHAGESLEETLHPTKIELPDGRLYISDHFWDRMREYDLDMKNVANTISKGFKQYKNAIAAIKNDDFVLMDRRRTGIAIRKTERPGGDSVYVLSTIHPTLRVGGGQQVYMIESDDLNVQFHDKLNPAIWKDGKMREDVRANLLKIAEDFQKSLGINLKGLKDITVSGSNAAYSYTPKSDIDLHLVADIPEADEDNIYRELFDAKKYQYNTEHDYKIRGYDVELYVQDASQEHVSQGIYSIMRDEWIREPQKFTGGFDQVATREKYDNLRGLIQKAIKTKDYFLADKLRATIKKYRQVGLHATGEFGPENLAFKAIRANGYLNKLYELLNDLKDQELSIPEHDEKLTEIDMSPSSLQKFAATPVAQAMTVGFEAEMIVPGLEGDDDDYDSEPDYDQDGYVNASSISAMTRDLASFFSDSASRASVERAVEEVNEEILEYMDRQFDAYVEDNPEEVVNQYKNTTELSKEEIETSIEERDSTYLDVMDTMREDFTGNWDDLEGALNNIGLEKYSDWDDRFGWGWPYYTEPEFRGGEVDGTDLAKQWSAYSGYKAEASRGYHSATREPGVWIFEPDSSINADSGYGGIEMVSPPMPLAQGMKALEDFFGWAEEISAEANRSTGFHMGVSIPNQTMDNVDHLKLILLLGDQNVLARFNRSANQYTKSILEKIKSNLRRVDIDKVFDTMRKGMNMIAAEAVSDEVIGYHDRYVSVNIKDNYVEFRSAGGNYFDKKDELRNVMLRYVRVMASAADPEADKQEYAKKLYKLMSTMTGDETNTIKAFSMYTAGTITRSELIGKLKQAQVARIQKKQPQEPEPDVTQPQQPPGNWARWNVFDHDDQYLTSVSARNQQEASQLALRWGRENNRVISHVRPDVPESLSESKSRMTGREMLVYYENCHHADIKNAKMRMYILENDWELGTCNPDELPNAEEYADDAFGRDMKLDIDQVARYMEAMNEGEEVMPIIMGPDKSVIDGNHRAQAARKLNKTIECYRAK